MNKTLLIFAFCVCAIVFLDFFGLAENQEIRDWVVRDGSDKWFSYPIIKYVGKAGYGLLGEPFFRLFPFTLFFIGLAFLDKTIKVFNLNENVYWACFLFVSYGLRAVAFFNRDNVLFCLGSIYAFCFFKTIFNHKNYTVGLVFVNVLMFAFREIGLVFAILTALLVLRQLFIKLNNNLNRSLVNMAELAVIPTPIYPSGNTIKDLFQAFQVGLNAIWPLQPQNFFKFFNNNVFGISLLCLLLKRTKWHAIIILLTFVYVYSIANTVFYSSVFRYSFSLVPLHLFFIANNTKFK